ncbi:Acetyltransferase YpeA [bacterium HR32]|nr:Acetyltransferase YpeA [bacterium HR32]
MAAVRDVRIRPAEVRDLAGVVELWGELARLHERLDGAFALSRTWRRAYEEYLSHLLGREDVLVVVAESQGELVGLAVGRITLLPAFFRRRRRGYIQDVYTREGYRGQGLGRALVARLEAWMRERGVRRVELTVAVGNAQAEAFWERSGYRAYMVYRGKDL